MKNAIVKKSILFAVTFALVTAALTLEAVYAGQASGLPLTIHRRICTASDQASDEFQKQLDALPIHIGDGYFIAGSGASPKDHALPEEKQVRASVSALIRGDDTSAIRSAIVSDGLVLQKDLNARDCYLISTGRSLNGMSQKDAKTIAAYLIEQKRQLEPRIAGNPHGGTTRVSSPAPLAGAAD